VTVSADNIAAKVFEQPMIVVEWSFQDRPVPDLIKTSPSMYLGKLLLKPGEPGELEREDIFRLFVWFGGF